MSPCVQFAPMIGARQGELSDDDSRALAEHLASCDACQARLADEAALSGMLADGLMREVSHRDFSSFSDGVLARIPAYREKRAGWLAPIASWVRQHRLTAAVSALAPAVAAVALVLYLGGQPAPEPSVEVSSEAGGAMVLETSDGPMVLFEESSGDGM
jgi:anti-sigma factor RsiW